MIELEEIEARVDQWHRFMLDEVDQAIRQAFEDIGEPAKQIENSQNQISLLFAASRYVQ